MGDVGMRESYHHADGRLIGVITSVAQSRRKTYNDMAVRSYKISKCVDVVVDQQEGERTKASCRAAFPPEGCYWFRR